MNNILTFDVEDNFTGEELSDPADWDRYENQVVVNTRHILDMLERQGATATFFVLGKVAERRPEIVRMISEADHEIASHGYIHERVPILGKTGFVEDIVKSKTILESLSGKPVKGFRAMAFSITTETLWALESLRQQGFRYDSSMLDTSFRDNMDKPELCPGDGFFEVTISTVPIAGRPFTVGGGIFFRMAPFPFITKIMKSKNDLGHPVLLYAHAWEFNKDQPRRKVSFLQGLAQSPATFTTPRRIERLLKEFAFTSIENHLGLAT